MTLIIDSSGMHDECVLHTVAVLLQYAAVSGLCVCVTIIVRLSVTFIFSDLHLFTNQKWQPRNGNKVCATAVEIAVSACVVGAVSHVLYIAMLRLSTSRDFSVVSWAASSRVFQLSFFGAKPEINTTSR